MSSGIKEALRRIADGKSVAQWQRDKLERAGLVTTRGHRDRAMAVLTIAGKLRIEARHGH